MSMKPKYAVFIEDQRAFTVSRNRITTSIPIAAGIILSWDKYSFTSHSPKGRFPKGSVKGDHILSISFIFLFWHLRICLYKQTPNT